MIVIFRIADKKREHIAAQNFKSWHEYCRYQIANHIAPPNCQVVFVSYSFSVLQRFLTLSFRVAGKFVDCSFALVMDTEISTIAPKLGLCRSTPNISFDLIAALSNELRTLYTVSQ